MQRITSASALKLAISQLELQKDKDLFLLKEEFHNTSNRLKPVNIIKRTFRSAISTPGIKTDLLNAVVGLTTGVLAKKLMVGKTINPFKKLLGIIVEMTVANKVATNAGSIRSAGNALFNTFIKKKPFTTLS